MRYNITGMLAFGSILLSMTILYQTHSLTHGHIPWYSSTTTGYISTVVVEVQLASCEDNTTATRIIGAVLSYFN